MIVVVATLTGSSPLTRGKLLEVLLHGALNGLIPAHAGKTGLKPPKTSRDTAHPRSRGENPVHGSASRYVVGSSPLTRGKHGHIGSGPHDGRLIPAHAGKTSIAALSFLTRAAHPRSRGENAKLHSPNTRALGSSPLTRGKHPGQSPTSPGYGLIPAHAGKTPRPVTHQPRLRAHPRSRGENTAGP